jgi:hypothetical protein
MGCSTILLINNNIAIRDIVTVIERSFETKCKVTTDNFGIDNGSINFIVPEKYSKPEYGKSYEDKQEHRNLFYGRNSYTPIGYVTYLSLGLWGSSDKIMEAIGKVFGGFYMLNDCGDKGYEKIDGMISPEDGLPFFVKYASVKGDMKDNDDIDGLKKCIDAFNNRNKS